MAMLNTTRGEDLLSSDLAAFLTDFIMATVVTSSLRVFGLCTNIVNIIVFWKSGLDDGMSVCFFAVAISDFASILILHIARFLMATAPFFGISCPDISLYWIGYAISFYSLMFYTVTVLLTIFISVQKCCCVALPFVFRHVFSQRRCLVVVGAIYTAVALTFLPFTCALTFTAAYDPSTNTTLLALHLTPFQTDFVFPLIQCVHIIGQPIAAEIVVLVCVLVLTFTLRQSGQFRRSATHGSVRVASKGVPPPLHAATTGGKPTPELPAPHFSLREVRVIQAVTAIAVIFIICNTPIVIIYTVYFFMPEFSFFGKYAYTFLLCHEVLDAMKIINMSINVFVYYSFNTKFRQQCLLLFKCH